MPLSSSWPGLSWLDPAIRGNKDVDPRDKPGDDAGVTRLSAEQLSLLEPVSALPEGFAYREDFVSATEEAELVSHVSALDLREFEFHGYLGKRRVTSFGLRYDFNDMAVHDAAEMPEFLLPMRYRAAAFAGLMPEELAHALVTEYTAGAAIGWHRDRPIFGDVIGISLGAPCRFRFRRPFPDPPPPAEEGRVGASRGSGWERKSLTLMPRSAYLLRGPARHEWQHSIPPVEALRYSVTFRSTR
jgi:alkylated DNA repair dioxygenase AlkB